MFLFSFYFLCADDFGTETTLRSPSRKTARLSVKGAWITPVTTKFIEGLIALKKKTTTSKWTDEDWNELGRGIGMTGDECKRKKNKLYQAHARLLKKGASADKGTAPSVNRRF